MSNQFEIRKEIAVPATVDQVWRAVATPEGQAGWSPDPYASTDGQIVVEEPHSRFSVRTPTESNGAFHQFEYLIDVNDDGTTLTFIHGGDLGDDWQADFDYAELTSYGWDLYMHTLQQYLTYFPGRQAVFVTGQAPERANTREAWLKLTDALGLSDGTAALSVGDTVRLTPKGLPAIDGVIDYVQSGEDFLAVRAHDGLYRFHSLERMGMPIAFGHYLYATSDDAGLDLARSALEQKWQFWLEKLYTQV